LAVQHDGLLHTPPESSGHFPESLQATAVLAATECLCDGSEIHCRSRPACACRCLLAVYLPGRARGLLLLLLVGLLLVQMYQGEVFANPCWSVEAQQAMLVYGQLYWEGRLQHRRAESLHRKDTAAQL